MLSTLDLADAEIDRLRRENYNATVVSIDKSHDELMILRVQPDGGAIQFTPGQYTVLGLGYWERRVPGTQEEDLDEKDYRKLAKRAYSISCRLIGGEGQLVRAPASAVLEFFVTLVRHAEARAPALTPRLFALAAGDGLHMSRHAHGHYTLDRVMADDDVVFAATGTGEAPHNAMLAELLATGHRGRIVSVNCVRYRSDLAYLGAHRTLEDRCPNYRYLTLTTREPENLDPTLPEYVGKQYLQDYFESGGFQADSGCDLNPATTHVFLCGNPEMIGVPHHTHDPAKRYPQPRGTVEVLEKRGFRVDQPHEPGNIHFEKYW